MDGDDGPGDGQVHVWGAACTSYSDEPGVGPVLYSCWQSGRYKAAERRYTGQPLHGDLLITRR